MSARHDRNDPARQAVSEAAQTPRQCPSCSVDADPERVLCHRCGVELASGDEPVTRPTTQPPTVPRVKRDAGIEFAAGWWPLLVVAVVAVAVIGALMTAGVGPFDRSTKVPTAPEFPLDGDTYFEPRIALELSDIATLTVADPADGIDFSPTHMVDHDPSTVWRSEPFDPGHERELVDLILAEPSWVEAFLVYNGDHRDAEAYVASGRIHRVLMTFDGGVRYRLDLLDIGLVPQAVELPEPVLTTSVRWEIYEIFPGAGHAGVAVSDLEVRGRLASDDEQHAATERAGVLPAQQVGR